MSTPESPTAPSFLFVGNKEAADNRAFGLILRQARKTAELSAVDVAEAVGVTPAFVRAIERGDQAPSKETATRLLATVGLRAEPDPQTRATDRRADLVFKDPASGRSVVVEFKANRKGDNTRWSLDRLAEPAENSEHSDHPASELFRALLALRHPEPSTEPQARYWEHSGESRWPVTTDSPKLRQDLLLSFEHAALHGHSPETAATKQRRLESDRLLSAIVRRLGSAELETLRNVARLVGVEAESPPPSEASEADRQSASEVAEADSQKSPAWPRD